MVNSSCRHPDLVWTYIKEPRVGNDTLERHTVDVAIKERVADPIYRVESRVEYSQPDAHEKFDNGPVKIRFVTVGAVSKGLLDLVGVLQVLLFQIGHILRFQGGLDEAFVELFQLQVRVVSAGRRNESSITKLRETFSPLPTDHVRSNERVELRPPDNTALK